MSDERRWIRGIDEPLPAGEAIRWTGTPDPRAVARHVVHERGWLAYLVVLAAAALASAAGRVAPGDLPKLAVLPALVIAVAWVGMRAWARAIARTTVYVVTDRRVVMRAGIAFPIAVNLPFDLIDEAGLRTFRDGTGEIRLALSARGRVAWSALWPHVETLRHLRNPRPMLRGLAAPHAVGDVLQRAITDAAARDGAVVTLGAGVRASGSMATPPSRAYGAPAEAMAT